MLWSLSVVFACTLAILLFLCETCADVNSLFSKVGWIVAIVYTANIVARLVVFLLPKETVSPKGKAVLITGCDSGFGHQLAQRLASQGFMVFAGCLSEDSEGAQELKQLCSSSVHILSLDVTKHDHVQAAFRKVEESLEGRELWALVNNAGVAIFSELEWCSMSIIEHMFNVNVLGAVRVTKVFLPLLRRSQGRVVVMSSAAGHITYPGFVSYSMTKHALVSFADGLRREMRKWGVTVVTIEPCMYKTRIARSDVLTGALDNSWEKTPDAIKEAYGFPYYEDFKGRMQRLAKHARPYLEEVVDCLEQTVLERRPKITYRCSGPMDKVRMWVTSLLPVQLLDLFICYVIQPSHRQLSGGSSSGKSS